MQWSSVKMSASNSMPAPLYQEYYSFLISVSMHCGLVVFIFSLGNNLIFKAMSTFVNYATFSGDMGIACKLKC